MLDKILPFRFVPRGSQTIILALFLPLGWCLKELFNNIRTGSGNVWINLALVLMFLVCIVTMWFRSRKDIDFGPPAPTSITFQDGQSMSKIITDQRNIPLNFEDVARFFSLMTSRRPLPEADGMLDDKGNPMDGSKEEARAMVDKVNQEVSQQQEYFHSLLGRHVPYESFNPDSLLDEHDSQAPECDA